MFFICSCCLSILCTVVLRTLDETVNNEIGLKFVIPVLLPLLESGFSTAILRRSEEYLYIKVNQSRYRPGVAQRVAGS